MALEDLTGTDKFIDDLAAANPAAGDDVSEGDDHIRGIKNVLKNTFPNVTGAVSSTHTNLDAAYTHSTSTHAPSGATVNDTDANLKARANHTGTQTMSTISDAGTSATLNVPATGNAATTEVVKGTDTRLSDDRTPTAHSHDVEGTALKSTGETGATKFLREDGNGSSSWQTISDTKWDGGSTGLNAGTGRTSLGLGDSATKDTGNASGTVCAGDDARLSDTRTPSDNSVTNAKMADDAVDSAEIVANAVGTTEIANNAVTNAKMADDSVGIAELSATGTASATTFLAGDNSWTAVSSDPSMGGDLSGTASNAQIKSGVVGTTELATDSVTAAKIATNAVGASEITANAVGASELNVSGNGTSGQMLTSAGDGTMTWADAGGGGVSFSSGTYWGSYRTADAGIFTGNVGLPSNAVVVGAQYALTYEGYGNRTKVRYLYRTYS